MKKLLLPVLTLWSLVGCQKSLDIELTLLRQSLQCWTTEPEMRLLASAAEIEQIAGFNTMLASPSSPVDVDFNMQAVVVLAMGQKPTAGYRIGMDAEQVEIRDKDLWLPVHFIPPQGDMAAAMVTRPCVVFSVRKAGLERIVAGDTGLAVEL